MSNKSESILFGGQSRSIIFDYDSYFFLNFITRNLLLFPEKYNPFLKISIEYISMACRHFLTDSES
jgi:hypothetical protein